MGNKFVTVIQHEGPQNNFRNDCEICEYQLLKLFKDTLVSNDQRRKVNLYLPSSSNQSSSYAVAASPAPSLIDLASPSPQWSRQSDNESVSSDTSYSNGMHTSGDDTDNEIELPPINMEVDPVPSVEYVPLEEPVPRVEVIPQEDSVDSVEPVAMEAIVEEVASLQNLPIPTREGWDK